jgi:tripartite-type tricarboxylate transporter receptor subunit TctC
VIERELNVIRFTIQAVLLAVLATDAGAQDYPTRALRIVVPYAPGGPVDIIARITGQKLTEALGQQVVVDNRTGAGGNIALELVARSVPDGYTLLMGSNGTNAINPSLYKKMPVDPEKELAAISMVASSALILVVHPSLPARSVKELIALARPRPGAIAYASAGSGSTAHLAFELFKNVAHADLLHVPYKGASLALVDVVAGQVQAMITGISGTLPYIKAGRMKPLGVTSEKRQPLLPEVPSISEQLPGYEVTTWYGVFAPAAVPRPVVDKLNQSLVKIFQAPDAQAKLAAVGADARTNTPEQFAQSVGKERVKWAKIIKESGARAE